MLDTNTVSYIAKRKSRNARRELSALELEGGACISAVTEGELLYGLARKPEAHVLREDILRLIAGLSVLPWDHHAAVAFGWLRAKQEQKGWPVETLDLMIAAHAVAIGAVLITNDHVFSQIEDLAGIANWATDL